MTPFGKDIHALTLDDLERFLADADSEPLLWEAKGAGVSTGSIRKAVCGFANGREPAYLILGAEQDDDGWRLEGTDRDDPPAWVSDAIGSRLRPVPRLDVATIRVTRGRRVAVVQVLPVAVPPCMTDGTVYERVSGRTVAVQDPERLADLYRRGDIARENALASSGSVARALLEDGRLVGVNELWPRIAVGVGASGIADDIGSLLFAESFEEILRETVDRRLTDGRSDSDHPFGPQVSTGFEQSNRWSDCADHHGSGLPVDWHLRAIWNGSVGVYATWHVDSCAPEQLVATLIAPAWQAASDLVAAVGGYGPAFSEIRVEGRRTLRGRDGKPIREIRMNRGPHDLALDQKLISSVERELRRSVGQFVYEPNPRQDVG
ncbi:MAG TPA: ATP-binding protein [Solirubrobacterales bacterium]|nr:ATP-binding protein [Solirubrobacterales bacterium]